MSHSSIMAQLFHIQVNGSFHRTEETFAVSSLTIVPWLLGFGGGKSHCVAWAHSKKRKLPFRSAACWTFFIHVFGKKEFYRISIDTFNFGFEIIEFI